VFRALHIKSYATWSKAGWTVCFRTCCLVLTFVSFGWAASVQAQETYFGNESAARLTLVSYEQPAIHTFLQSVNFPTVKESANTMFGKLRNKGRNAWEFYKVFTRTLSEQEVRTTSGTDSSFALLRRNMPARHNYGTYAKLQAGYGQYFPADTLGRSRINGAGLDEPNFAYLQVILNF
jgi:hypothetical protein